MKSADERKCGRRKKQINPEMTTSNWRQLAHAALEEFERIKDCGSFGVRYYGNCISKVRAVARVLSEHPGRFPQKTIDLLDKLYPPDQRVGLESCNLNRAGRKFYVNLSACEFVGGMCEALEGNQN